MAKRKHLISVLIPTYNAPEYFRIALESARQQSYAPLEIIVCDNSTDDRTERLMRAYKDDKRIRYVRNRAAKTKEENFAPFEHLVRGDYVQWLMHDDVLLPGKLEKMAAILDTYPNVTLVSSQRNIIDAEGHARPSNLQSHLEFEGEYRIFSGEFYGNAMLRSVGNYVGEPSAVLFRRRDLAHPYYHAECRGYLRISDVAMWLELMEKGDYCLFREPLSSYRRHAGQEGQQFDVALESRVEWVRLEREYYARGVFFHNQEEYVAALRILLKDYDDLLHTPDAFQQASPSMLGKYRAAMKSVAEELGVELPTKEETITSCLIYRDEAARLGDWLAKAETYSGEFVLADTGATDGSAKIAQSFAEMTPVPVKLLTVPWHGDFAAARNHALDVAEGDWIIFLDADETFEHPERVREILAQLPDEVQGVQVPVINVDEDAGGQEISRFPALRIWRRQASRRYEGRIHEALYEGGKPLSHVVQEPRLAVRHTGYSTRRMHAKLVRNLQMLQDEAKQRDPRTLYRYLADCCYGLGAYAEALDYAMRAIEQEPETVAGKQPLYLRVLDAMKGLGRPLEEQLAFARAAQREHPDWLDMMAQCGLLAEKSGDAALAEDMLTSFLQALEKMPQGAAMQATSAMSLQPAACRTLGKLRLAAGDFTGAEPLLRRALTLSRYDEAALSLWEALCRKNGQDFLASLQTFYDDAPEARAFLRGWVLHEGQAAYLSSLAPDLATVSYEEAVQRGASKMTVLFQALFAGGRALFEANPAAYRAARKLLPDSMQYFIDCGLEGGTSGAAEGRELTAEDADGYQSGLDAMISCQDREALKRYIALAGQFGWEMVLVAAEKLCEQEEWGLAYSLYEQVPEDEIGDAGAFWYHVGLCLYHLGGRAADECFAKAEAAGCTSQDIAAYRAWMKAWATGEEGAQ